MKNPLLEDLLNSLGRPFTAESLFDRLPDTVYFMKNADGFYVAVNETLVERCGKQHKSELIGRRPSDVLGDELGKSYEIQDRAVLRSGRQLLDQMELHMYPSRELDWCLTHKLPMLDVRSRVAGLVGMSQDLKLPELNGDDFRRIASAVRHAEGRIAGNPGIRELAAIAGMSPYQLDRRMKRVFGVSTGQWLLKTRISHASRQLTETTLPIAEVALNAGYHDQSAFTRRFRLATGFTPSKFRRLRAAEMPPG